MKLLAIAATLFAVAAPSNTIRLAIVHAVSGCHVWQTTRALGPTGTLTLRPGGKIVLRVNCPMDFTITQVRGPKLNLGDPTMHTGTSRTLVFVKRGTYVLRAVNLQTSEQAGLQTLGLDNVLKLTVKVS
ncbi:MAG TPA: hypothetical protein VIL77_11845 [Gaiellaceae bacterium]